jgi:predicted ribosomally synthesized peptide with nif11-like leader
MGQEMSAENITRFFELLDRDGSLQQEYMVVTDEAIRIAVRRAVIGLAAKHGCDFTEEELNAHAGNQTVELSDEELARVAGGSNPGPGRSPTRYSDRLMGFLQPGGSLKPLHKQRRGD